MRTGYLLLFCLVSSTGGSMPMFNPRLISPNPLQTIILPPVSPPRTVTPLGPAAERTLSISRRQSEVLPQHLAADREPSCSELRTMWRKMRRMSRQMEMTNEIPRVPDPFYSSAYNYRPSKYPDANPYSPKSSSVMPKAYQKSDEYELGMMSPTFGKIVQDSEEDHRYYKTKNHQSANPVRSPHLGFDDFDDGPKYVSKGRVRIPGRFSNFPLPEESLGVFGTVVHTPEEKARYRASVRKPQSTYNRNRWNQNGSSYRYSKYPYGSVVSVTPEADKPVTVYHPRGGLAEYPTEVGQRSNGGTRVERIDQIAGKLQISCLRLLNKTCKTDLDCSCSGNPKLLCISSRCKPFYKTRKYMKPNRWSRSHYVDPYESNFPESDYKQDPIWTVPY